MKKTWIAVLILAVLAVVEKGMNWNFASRIIRTDTEYVRYEDDYVQESVSKEYICFYDPKQVRVKEEVPKQENKEVRGDTYETQDRRVFTVIDRRRLRGGQPALPF